MTRRKNTSHPDPVLQYALDVTEGREIAGPLVRLACERHLRDLESGAARGLVWDLAAAKRVIGFFHDALKLAGGEHEGKPFQLHPSQQFIVGSLFGWKGKDGYRRFRVAYIEQGKGNGKSPLAAGIGLYMLTADNEPRAEVYAAAVDKDQARILFRDAVAMVDQSPALDTRIQRSGGKGKEWNLAYLDTVSYFRPVASEYVSGRGKSGFRPHCALLDEVHEHPSTAMIEFMRAGTKGRRQALILMITNAGVYDLNGAAFQYHDYSDKVLNQQIENDSFFSYVCALDKGDDWKDPSVWRKTNPLLGVSISEKYLQEQVMREAEGMPSKQSLVRRLNFCEWVESADPFVEPEVWRANGSSVAESELRGRYGGLDLSGKNDLTALCLVFPLDDGTKAVLSFFWTPGDTLRKRQEHDRAPYVLWVEQGLLVAKPGSAIDYGWVAHELAELASIYDIEALAFDRWRIEDLVRELDDIGVNLTVKEHGQGYRDMNPAVEALEDDLLEGRLRHGNHPVLSWCIGNAKVVEDPAGLRKFDKRKATGRIDGAVALAMACNIAANMADENAISYTGLRSVG
jgi:phage terminase large subunit-like protein